MLPIPIGTDRTQRRFPWMNLALIAANVVIYVMSHPLTGNHGPASPANLGRGWEGYMLWPTAPHLYQFITYQFLHENLSHILFNMLFLYVFGNNLNEKLGHVGYLAFYLAGGILAGCGQMLTSESPTLGASGAISAVAGLFLVLLPRTHIRMFIWLFVYVDVWEIPSFYFILFSAGKDLLEPLLWGGNGTAYSAHLSGTAAGFLIGILLLTTRLVQRDHYDLLAVFHRWRRRKQYEAVVAGGYNPFGPGGRVLEEEAQRKAVEPPKNFRAEGLRMEIGELIHSHQLSAAAVKYRELRQVESQAVLGMDDQLDVANQLMADKHYPEAATAYEDLLRVYPGGAQRDQVMLVLGVIYSQYLPRRERAIEMFRNVMARLHDQKQRAILPPTERQLMPVLRTFRSWYSTDSCTGRSSAWLEHLVWDQDVAGSNPVAPNRL